MHQFLAVTFPEQSHPAQLVVGNSGVATSLATPEGPFEATIDQTAARALGSGTHGFMDLRHDGPHWTATLTGADGSTLVRCTLGAMTECSPAAARRMTAKERGCSGSRLRLAVEPTTRRTSTEIAPGFYRP